MRDWWQMMKGYASCLGVIIRLGRLLGSVEILLTRLEAMEKGIRSENLSSRCSHCGSRELEPTFSTVSADGLQVTKFRCKACGQEMMT